LKKNQRAITPARTAATAKITPMILPVLGFQPGLDVLLVVSGELPAVGLAAVGVSTCDVDATSRK
jgi:hypothetical protein